MTPSPSRWAPAAALGLFVVWSNSFIAIGYLLGREQATAQLDWVDLTVARFVGAGVLCGLYCFALRRRESLEILRRHGFRLLVCGFLAVPAYNLSLYYAQQHGVAAPVASLVTALVPLFVMLLSVLFLGERLTVRRVTGFAVAAAGVAAIAAARPPETGVVYPALIGLAAVAPLSWSVYSVVSKPLAERVSPTLWSYLATVLGAMMVAPLLRGSWRRIAALDAAGWFALLYLVVPCTVLGFAVWTWLLRQLPATVVGFTVFLNPPLTTLSKVVLAALLPTTFVFVVGPREWFGGVVTLLGMAVALWRPRH